MNILVTGGAGFIGSHMVDALLKRGNSIRVLDDLSTGSCDNLATHQGDPHFSFCRGSVVDGAAIRDLAKGCDLIYHLAAAIGVRYVIDDPLGGISTNVRGTEEVLAAAHLAGARVVLASSSEVYGKGKAGDAWQPFREDSDSVLGPTTVTRWWYALAKGLDEHLAFAYHRQRGLAVSAVRYFNIYGPRCDPGGYGVLARFISCAVQDRPLTVYGDGKQTRSFTYVDDAVRATILAGERVEAIGEVFNVGSAYEVSIGQAAHSVLELTGSASAIQYQEHQDVFGPDFEDTRRRVPDVTKAQRVLGFSAEIAVVDGVQRTAAWWRAKSRVSHEVVD